MTAGSLLQTVARTDYVRGFLPLARAARPEDRPPRKEWFHFCVVTGELQLVVNFSLSADLRPAAPSASPLARVIVLLRGKDWAGGVDTVESALVRAPIGDIELTLGPHSLTFADGAFHVAVNMKDPPLSVRARLRPETVPLVGLGADLGEGKLSWVVIPRLSASGVVSVAGRKHRFEQAPAYHDHNWGVWPWGADFAWQWGFALPDDPRVPWCLVYSRLTNAARTRELDTKLCVWRGATVVRTFQGADLTFQSQGWLRPARVRRFPPVMSLLAEGSGTDVPKIMSLSARTREDRIDCQLEPEDVAQIVIPNETDLDVTLLNEVTGRARVSGHFGGESISFTGRGVFELVQRK